MRKSKIYNYTPEELQKLLDKSHSYSNILSLIGLSGNGGCHNTLKRIIEEYQLDTTKFSQNKKEFIRNQISTCKFNSYSLEEILVENSTYSCNQKIKNKLIKTGLKE